MPFIPKKAQRDMTPSERKTAIASGVAPQRLTMPNLQNLQITGNPTGAATIQNAQQPGSGTQPLLNVMKPLDPNEIGDPMIMSVDAIQNLKYGHGVQILVEEAEPSADGKVSLIPASKGGAPAKMLVAFSEVARVKLAGSTSVHPKLLRLGVIPPLSVERLISYLGGVCTPAKDAKEPKMKTIYTSKMDWDIWLGIWKLAEDLQMPHVLAQLKRQTRGDLKDEGVESTVNILAAARKAGIEGPDSGITGRLWALAKGEEPNFELDVAGVEAMMAVTPNAKFTKHAITNLADKAYNAADKNDTSGIQGASEQLTSAVLEKFEYFHSKDVEKEQGRVDAIANRRDRRAREIVGWNSETGKEARYYLP